MPFASDYRLTGLGVIRFDRLVLCASHRLCWRVRAKRAAQRRTHRTDDDAIDKDALDNAHIHAEHAASARPARA